MSNKVTVVINGRRYTLVADAEKDYMLGLAQHVSEKVDEVLKKGQNVMGERPIVLAALNICDEFFKLYQASLDMRKELERSSMKTEELTKALKKAENTAKRASQKGTQNAKTGTQNNAVDENLRAQVMEYSKELTKTQTALKEAESRIKELEKKHTEELERMKAEYVSRENEFLEMIDKA